MREPTLKVTGLGKRYPRDGSPRRLFKELLVARRGEGRGGWRWALEGIDFAVSGGRGLGIVGHNGAGKSTLLRLLTGVAVPTAGTLERRGRIGGILEIGGGFQPDLTGRENLMTAGLVSGLTRRQVLEREEAIVEFAELGEVIDQPLRTYSTGMFLRLGFSTVVHTDPDILVIDEFLAVGDARFRERCLDALERFRSRGGILVLASHDFEPLRRLCQETLVLERGRVAAHGPTGQLLGGS